MSYALFLDSALTKRTSYSEESTYHKAAKDRIHQTFSLLKDHIKDCDYLDIGASPFYLMHLAKSAGAKTCTGTYFAHDSHPLRGHNFIYSPAGQLEIVHSNIETDKLPFPDQSYDVVTACEILEHLEFFPDNLLTEVRRVLRPGGVFCMTVPNVGSAGNIAKLIIGKNVFMPYRVDPTGRHKHEYTLNEVKDLLSYGNFRIENSGYLKGKTSSKAWLKMAYSVLSYVPFCRRFLPIVFAVARVGEIRSSSPKRPKSLYVDALSVEE